MSIIELSSDWECADNVVVKVQLSGTDITRRIPWQHTAASGNGILEGLCQTICDRFGLQRPISLSHIDDSGILIPVKSIEFLKTMVAKADQNQFGEKVINIQVLKKAQRCLFCFMSALCLQSNSALKSNVMNTGT